MADKNKKSGMNPWLVVAIALADDVAVVALVFIILWAFDITLSVPALIVLVVVGGTLVFIVHRAIVPSLRRRQVTGSGGMIGQYGEVTEALKPGGTVLVKGEYWQAKSMSGDIHVGEKVEIVDINRLVLKVKRKGS